MSLGAALPQRVGRSSAFLHLLLSLPLSFDQPFFIDAITCEIVTFVCFYHGPSDQQS